MKTKHVYCITAILVVICLIGLVAGCGKHGDSKTSGTSPRDITVSVYIDRSESTLGYLDGGSEGIRRDYRLVAERFLRPLLGRRNDVLIEARAFVREEVILFAKKVDRWDQIRQSLKTELDQPPYTKSVAERTLFSVLLDKVRLQCERHPERDLYVVVLSDGHPDESFETIKEAAERFAADGPKNLKLLLVAPVAPDMRMRWRENLAGALCPIKVARVANVDDCETVLKEAAQKMEDQKQ